MSPHLLPQTFLIWYTVGMNEDKNLETEISQYQALAKENKNIDVAALMLNALKKDTENPNRVPTKWKRWAYFISIGLPPFGLLFAAKYYFDDKDDARHVANVCVILTVVGVLSLWLMGKVLLSSSGTSLDQIQQIKPADIMQLTQ